MSKRVKRVMISLYITEETKKRMEELVREGRFMSVSDAIRYAIHVALLRNRDRKGSLEW
ncbi:MAG: ribbon-helix-helix domain-containing protein [Nitrososphaerota archaeon]